MYVSNNFTLISSLKINRIVIISALPAYSRWPLSILFTKFKDVVTGGISFVGGCVAFVHISLLVMAKRPLHRLICPLFIKYRVFSSAGSVAALMFDLPLCTLTETERGQSPECILKFLKKHNI